MQTSRVPAKPRPGPGLAFTLAVFLAGCGSPETSAAPPRPAAMWAYADLATQAFEREAFFAFAAPRGCPEVFLSASDLLASAPAELGDFIQQAQARGIRVGLLMGRASWSLAAGRGEALARARAARNFAAGLRAAGKSVPSSLHLDVEPHTLPEWNTDFPGTAAQFVDLLEAVKAELGPELPLAVDIPVWWDSRMLTRNGATKSLCEWVIAIADTTVLMDYRDTADAIIASAEAEIAIGRRLGKRVLIGLDAKCGDSSDGPAITFCEEGHALMVQAMATVDDAFRSQASYGGLAVFSYEDWKALKP